MSGSSTAVSGHLQHQSGLISLVVLLALVALFAIDVGGIVLVVRRFGRLSRVAKSLVVIVAAYMSLGAVTVFVQELTPGGDWWGAPVSSAFIVLYGVVACGVVLFLDASAKRLHRSTSLRV